MGVGCRRLRVASLSKELEKRRRREEERKKEAEGLVSAALCEVSANGRQEEDNGRQEEDNGRQEEDNGRQEEDNGRQEEGTKSGLVKLKTAEGLFSLMAEIREGCDCTGRNGCGICELTPIRGLRIERDEALYEVAKLKDSVSAYRVKTLEMRQANDAVVTESNKLHAELIAAVAENKKLLAERNAAVAEIKNIRADLTAVTRRRIRAELTAAERRSKNSKSEGGEIEIGGMASLKAALRLTATNREEVLRGLFDTVNLLVEKLEHVERGQVLFKSWISKATGVLTVLSATDGDVPRLPED
jgi:hypothetical protein